MKKIREIIHSIIEVCKDIGIFVLAIITAKDPCKKCIVKACCTEKCEERICLENFILKGDNTLFYTKFITWFIIIYIPSILIILIYDTIKCF